MDRNVNQTGVIPVLGESFGLDFMLGRPDGATALVVFAHGSGSSRFSPRNSYVAKQLQKQGFATLLFDLLTEEEAQRRNIVFDIALLADRVGDALRWVRSEPTTSGLDLGMFGASTGAAAALVAAARWPDDVDAIVSRGGRPDLAGEALVAVRAPTLLIVGGADIAVIGLNEDAFARLSCEKELKIVPGASHLFEEPGTLTAVVKLSASWFSAHIR
ncbi:Putative phosphoribosyl transferase [Defluviimonas aquaemixtae]|uniref:Phosphoribosyl transferase n=1 Tax=Albidovulum aquaemixtae TaxID=1542388 RepID=A0A2R8BJE6_9RHOB|nr:dienelactone hydrolase family protein [Defluviimonas aquaemixtae]SPH23494.1 Putative phosphoribosyl transferase [Defluviimonas aquaemixtae]